MVALGRVAARLAGSGRRLGALRERAARRQLPRPALRRPQRLHADRRGGALPAGRRRQQGRGRRHGAGQPARRPDVAAPGRPELLRGRPHHADRPVRRRRHDARAARRAGGRRHAVRDQRRRRRSCSPPSCTRTSSAGRTRSTPPSPRPARRSTSSCGTVEWATPVLFMGDVDVELFHFQVAAAPLPPPPPPSSSRRAGAAAVPPAPAAARPTAAGRPAASDRSLVKVLAGVGALLVALLAIGIIVDIADGADGDRRRPAP